MRRNEEYRIQRVREAVASPDWRGRTHGMAWTPEFQAWHNMKDRCTRPACRSWPRYGGRGITVCDRWLASFEAFYEDMGPRPSATHSLDRIDNDGPYSPENCRWATRAEQNANRSDLRLLAINGHILSVTEWAKVSGVKRNTIYERLRRGWEPELAVFTPTPGMV